MVPGVVKAACGSTSELEEKHVEVWRTGCSKAEMGASAWTSEEKRGRKRGWKGARSWVLRAWIVHSSFLMRLECGVVDHAPWAIQALRMKKKFKGKFKGVTCWRG